VSDKLNVGIIGAGRIGRLHAEHLAYRIPQADVVAVADIILEAAQKCAATLYIPTAVQDYRVILENPEIEAVIICSSTDTHAQMMEEAAAAGKQIFCEKPIALDLTRIDRALEAVEKAGVKLQVGFNRRFDANFRRVRQAVVQGEIGKPHLLHIVSRDPAPPPIEYIQVSGGIFLDMTIHDFDMARFLIGSEVEEIYATGGVMVDPAIGKAGDIDTTVITLRFENGIVGTIDNSRQAVYGYDQRVEVFGSRGSISVGNNYPNTATIRGAQSIHRDLPFNFFMDRYVDAYIAEMQAFIACIQQDTEPPVTGQDARIPVVMGYAARKSYEENRPVRLSEISATS
jgi:myo-inositol 2-dehydrogenase/D-chiro-inositol 1-dehydrogenase